MDMRYVNMKVMCIRKIVSFIKKRIQVPLTLVVEVTLTLVVLTLTFVHVAGIAVCGVSTLTCVRTASSQGARPNITSSLIPSRNTAPL